MLGCRGPRCIKNFSFNFKVVKIMLQLTWLCAMLEHSWNRLNLAFWFILIFTKTHAKFYLEKSLIFVISLLFCISLQRGFNFRYAVSLTLLLKTWPFVSFYISSNKVSLFTLSTQLIIITTTAASQFLSKTYPLNMRWLINFSLGNY